MSTTAELPIPIGPERVKGAGEHHIMGQIIARRIPHTHIAHVPPIGDARCVERRGLTGCPLQGHTILGHCAFLCEAGERPCGIPHTHHPCECVDIMRRNLSEI